MTLKKKIIIGYAVVFALMGLVVLWAILNIVSLGNATGAILSENYKSILSAQNMMNSLERQDSAILLILMKKKERGIAQFRENDVLFLAWLTKAGENITIEGEREIIHLILTDYTTYRHHFFMMKDLTEAIEGEPFVFYEKTLYPLFTKIKNAVTDLSRLNEKAMYGASEKAGEVAKRAIWSTAIVAAIALFVALTFILLLIERIISDENKSEAILASIEDGLAVFDTRLMVTAINPAAREILGVDSRKTGSLNGQDLISDGTLLELIKQSVEGGETPSIPDEKRVIRISREEREKHYLFSVTTIKGRDKTLTGIVLLLRDITRLKEVEQLKTDFIMAASHELRTPLTSLGMSVDLLLEHAITSLSEKDRELLVAAHEEVHRMKALVNDLLDLSRIEAGRIEMEFENVLVSTLFDHVVSIFKGQFDMKEIVFTWDTADQSLCVRADANKITWVLSNLVSNALRYVQKGGHIELSAKRTGSQIHLSVKDNGPGIPLEYQTKIFQKFVQVRNRESGGSGLGLAICKEIVRAHGGTIWVESSQGRGSRFTFTIPPGK